MRRRNAKEHHLVDARTRVLVKLDFKFNDKANTMYISKINWEKELRVKTICKTCEFQTYFQVCLFLYKLKINKSNQ